MRAWREGLAAGLLLLALPVAAEATDGLAVPRRKRANALRREGQCLPKLQSGEARRFTIGRCIRLCRNVVADRFAPDFTKCDMSNAVNFKFNPGASPSMRPTNGGLSYVRQLLAAEQSVGQGRRGSGTVLSLQLWTKGPARAEVPVLYPPTVTGAHALPPSDLSWSAGSSFMIGPGETEGKLSSHRTWPMTHPKTSPQLRAVDSAVACRKLDEGASCWM
jgi:hypothetical protein